MSYEIYFLWLQGLMISLVLFFCVWCYTQKSKNAGLVDIFWALGFILLASFYSYKCRQTSATHLVLLFVFLVWCVRLTLHLALRFSKSKSEDSRYKAFRRAWGDRAALGLLLAFALQAVLQATLSYPLLCSALYPASSFAWPQISGILILLLSIFGEALADKQLEDFKADRAAKVDKGASGTDVCRVGLWNYSRHPNYFFQWLGWVGIALYVTGCEFGTWAIFCPLLMYFFLTRVTGVKASEAESVKTRPAYAQYQKETSAFFPWFKKT